MSQSDVPEIVDGEPVYSVVPWSGEALALADMPTDQIARVLDEAREFEYTALRSFKRELQDEILSRMDAQAKWTLDGDGWKLTGDSPNRSEWDIDQLRKALWAIIEDGLLSPETAWKAVKVEVTYKPVAAGINALLKLGGDVRDRIEACRVESSKPRAVRVTRS